MAHQLNRLADDAIGTWSAMPKSQALRWYGGVSAARPHRSAGALQGKGFRVKWLDDAGYPVEPRGAGYIYASKTGSLKD